MTCPTPCHDYTHRSGRCECGTNASRAAVGLPPLDLHRVPGLNQEDGGESVHGGSGLPVDMPEFLADPEPEHAAAGKAWAAWAMAAFLAALAWMTLAVYL